MFTIITLNYFSGKLLISLHLFDLVGFYLASLSVKFFDGCGFVPVLLLLGLMYTVLEFAGRWVHLGLGAEMRNSGRAHTD